MAEKLCEMAGKGGGATDLVDIPLNDLFTSLNYIDTSASWAKTDGNVIYLFLQTGSQSLGWKRPAGYFNSNYNVKMGAYLATGYTGMCDGNFVVFDKNDSQYPNSLSYFIGTTSSGQSVNNMQVLITLILDK